MLRLLQRIPRWVSGRLPRPFARGDSDNAGDRDVARGGEPVPPSPYRRTYPGGLAPEGGTSVRLPGYNFPPRGALPVEELGEGNVDNAGPNTQVPIVTFRIPEGLQLRITGIGITADDESRLTRLRWNLVTHASLGQGGVVVGDPSRYTAMPCYMGSTLFPMPINYVVPGDSTIILSVNPAIVYSVATFRTHVYVRLVGYLFVEAPLDLEEGKYL